MTTAILLGAFGAYCLRAASDAEGTAGAQWFHALLGYDQLKTRLANSVSPVVKLQILGWVFLALAARALRAAWSV